MTVKQLTLEEIGELGSGQSRLSPISKPIHPPTKYNRYTEEEIRIIMKLYPTVNNAIIAKMLSRTVRGIGEKAKSLGIKKRLDYFVNTNCAFCGNNIKRYKRLILNNTFCNTDCYTMFRRLKNRVVECSYCGVQFHKKPSQKRVEKNFCNATCMKLGMVGENNSNWLGGHYDYYGANWITQRVKARERDGHTCQRCGVKNIGKNHSAHHIIPFRMFGLKNYIKANQLDNLITLCQSCHMVVERNL